MQDAVVRDMVVQDTWWPSLAEGGAGPPRGLRAARPATGSSLDHSFVHTQSLSLVLALPPPSTSPGTTPRPAPHLPTWRAQPGLSFPSGEREKVPARPPPLKGAAPPLPHSSWPAPPSPTTSPGTTPRPAPHLSDGCHAHGLIVVQGGIGCAHVVAEACNCHLVTAV